MRRSFSNLSWTAILVATLVYYVLGAAWGSSPVGALYYQALGFVPPDGWAPGTAMYLAPLAQCFAASVVTALLASAIHARTIADGLALGAALGVGFAAVAGNDAVGPHNARPGVIFAILGTYHLVSMLAVSTIIATWRKGSGRASARPARSRAEEDAARAPATGVLPE